MLNIFIDFYNCNVFAEPSTFKIVHQLLYPFEHNHKSSWDMSQLIIRNIWRVHKQVINTLVEKSDALARSRLESYFSIQMFTGH